MWLVHVMMLSLFHSRVMCVWHLAISGLEFQKLLLMGNSNEPYFIPFPISVDIACRVLLGYSMNLESL